MCIYRWALQSNVLGGPAEWTSGSLSAPPQWQTAAERRGALEERAEGRAGASGGITPGVTLDSALIRSRLPAGGELKVYILNFWD